MPGVNVISEVAIRGAQLNTSIDPPWTARLRSVTVRKLPPICAHVIGWLLASLTVHASENLPPGGGGSGGASVGKPPPPPHAATSTTHCRHFMPASYREPRIRARSLRRAASGGNNASGG